MQQISDLLFNTLAFVSVTIFLFATVIVLLISLRPLIRKSLFKKKIKSKEDKTSPDEIVLLIKIPPTNEQKEEAMEAFLHSLHRILSEGTHISFEMVSANQFLSFYIVVPKNLKNIIESQLYAQYSEAEIEVVKDYYDNFTADNTVTVELGFKKGSIYPLNTYKYLEEDLLKNLSAMLSKSEKDEQISIQLALKRVSSKWWNRGAHVALFKLKEREYKEGHPGHEKLSHDLFQGKLRISYRAADKVIARSRLDTIVNLFKGIKSSANELKKSKPLWSVEPRRQFKARMFESGDLWSLPEIATIFHFPYKGAIVSNVVNTTSKRAPAPDILPSVGIVRPQDMSVFGMTNYRNDGKQFGLKRLDRRRHLYVVGKTGSGKSRLLELLLISDIQSGQGCCLLDPHGDLADELLKYVPKERIKDVVYISPSDRDFPIGFNPLEAVEDHEMRQHLSVFFIAIFKKLFAATWNPQMEHLIRYITLALLETPDSNILGIPRILSDTTYRQQVVMQIKDPVVKSFWTNEFPGFNEKYSSIAVVPILNKVGQFISNPTVRNMIGQQKNALDFEKFMNEGKIVLINVSKGKLGDDNAALLGSMFITKIQQAALARARIEEDKRRDFYFYVDEFQNFATDAFSSILSEARKYHLDLTIAHQYIAQLPDEVKATAFGNVGSMIVFAVGGDDAAYLAKEFSPVFTPNDMINLNTREMYVKMSVDGKLTTPFSAVTLSVPKPTFDYSIEIIDKSRTTYARNKVQVENEINRWTSGKITKVESTANEGFPEPII
jgi:hypothetical protein